MGTYLPIVRATKRDCNKNLNKYLVIYYVQGTLHHNYYKKKKSTFIHICIIRFFCTFFSCHTHNSSPKIPPTLGVVI